LDGRFQRKTRTSISRLLTDGRNADGGSPNGNLHRRFITRMRDDNAEKRFKIDEVRGELRSYRYVAWVAGQQLEENCPR
jgi:hypothetical protein